MEKFSLRVASTPEEIISAQRLRYQVFNVEMGRGLKAARATGLDRDAYDALCDHILIVDNKTQETIGTYRLLLRSRLAGGFFYAENEFDLTRLKSALDGEVMEMGRSCVRRDHRRNDILNLLWSGIMDYMNRHRVAYIIGCPSLYTTDAAEISQAYAFLRRHHAAPEAWGVLPRPDKVVPGFTAEARIDGQERRIRLKLPALVRSYLRIGAVVCGPPAIDREFGTVDFFMMLEVARMAHDYLERFRVGGAA